MNFNITNIKDYLIIDSIFVYKDYVINKNDILKILNEEMEISIFHNISKS